MANNPVNYNKILWLDMEWTGLEVEINPVVEVAAIVTDLELNEIIRYEGPSVAKLTENRLDDMNTWCRTVFTNNGLMEEILNSKHLLKYIDVEFADWVRRVFDGSNVVMAGNSIHNDRIWIKRWMPALDKELYYRQIDITAFKMTLPTILGDDFVPYPAKQDKHRAITDVEESIAEYRYYRDLLRKGI